MSINTIRTLMVIFTAFVIDPGLANAEPEEDTPALKALRMGVDYDIGRGKDQDLGKARSWYLKSAKLGNFEAQFNLATLMLEGKGGPKDPKGAEQWYLAAAKGGIVPAKYNLALMYLSDPDEGKNTEGRKWMLSAAKGGHPRAQYQMARIYAASQEPNEVVISKWYLKSAEGGYAKGQIEIAIRYDQGIGVIPSKENYFKWVLEAARQNQRQAQILTSGCYFHGSGTEKDTTEGASWLYVAQATKYLYPYQVEQLESLTESKRQKAKQRAEEKLAEVSKFPLILKRD